MSNYWLDNAACLAGNPKGKAAHFLLDLGYVKCDESRDRCDQIMATCRIGRTNIELAGFGRLLLRIPPKKLAAVLAAFPDIQEGAAYCWTTHKWIPPEGAALENAISYR
ncbi:MAG: hypothetical protein IMZ55_15085 [Acidobacteria bacterium]|nr:hypothetical protein [Acidobacteriota bacterium]